jgi:hypothetical protein
VLIFDAMRKSMARAFLVNAVQVCFRSLGILGGYANEDSGRFMST